ncbi:hypothetical protein [Corallococcus sicarius]|uniref:Uncharacterized protein n=1 Tax=Corallococcus sicarius TaxID=2316726 RepID=A0A3A8NX20_9BACT|nr:hypothetical protein [Corallococcus sicarius]RKH47690.1 hypothetical protein D7X12_02190 [Corallococcus sicarius]
MTNPIRRALAALLTLTCLGAMSAHAAGVQGPVPPVFQNRLMVGLFEEAGQNWMRDSDVPWDARYRYFTKGWADNWGYGARDGSWAASFFTETKAQGYVPVVTYYQLFGEPGGGEQETLAKLKNASTMRSYFEDVKLLLQRAKTYGGPVVVHVEPDAVGFLQFQTASNPGAYAAIAASGMPELAGLPNTVAGWSLAFLQLRKAVGANNVVLGLHISAWASGKDLVYNSLTDPLQPEVDKVVNFLKPMGLAANVTGSTYDVLFGDPLDRDADFYRLTRGEDHLWSMSDTASITSKSFNRYAEWLRLFNQTSGKRWVLWQIPLGNSNHLNINNAGGARQGYKDNRTEYFFGAVGDLHRRKFANVGVVALLFGAGAGGQSSYQNDLATDGQPYLKQRAKTFLQVGGLALPAIGTTLPLPGSGSSDGGTSPVDAGTPPVDGGTDGGVDGGTRPDGGVDGGVDGGTRPDAGTGTSDAGTPTDPSKYGFESGTQGFVAGGAAVSAVSTSTTRAYAGTRSLAVPFNGTSGGGTVAVANAAVGSGRTVTFRLWLPTGSNITGVQPYALEGAASNWRWTGNWVAVGSLKAGAWNAITVTLPSGSTTPLYQLGLEFQTGGTWKGTAYLDAVTW